MNGQGVPICTSWCRGTGGIRADDDGEMPLVPAHGIKGNWDEKKGKIGSNAAGAGARYYEKTDEYRIRLLLYVYST